MSEQMRYMKYNGRCGCHFMRPAQTSDATKIKDPIVDPGVADLPAAGKITFYLSKNKHGLRKDFDYEGTPVVFNNPYRQTLDESGKPLLRSIFSGAFQSTDQPDFVRNQESPNQFDVVREKRSGKRTNIPRPCNVDMSRNVPLMQSMVNGYYYGEAGDVQKYYVQKPTLMQKYRQSVTDYSKVVKTIKPARQMTNGSHSPASRKSFDVEIPKTEEEVINFYDGRPTTQTAAVMAKYLANCSEKEKMRFSRTVRTKSYDIKISSPPPGAGLIPLRAESQNSAHLESTSNTEEGAIMPANGGTEAKVAKLTHQQALAMARNMVRNRGQQHGPGGPNSVRPASVSEVTSPSLPASISPVRVARRGGDTMHKDLQISAFGATFATSGLTNLESILKK